jgi:hypothetical protein
MTAFKNFTQAMAAQGIELNPFEQRTGHAKARDGSGRTHAFAVTKTDTDSGSIVGQRFVEGGRVLLTSLKRKRTGKVVASLNNAEPIQVWVGGDFQEPVERTVRTRNPGGKSWRITKETVLKTVPGVVFKGNYLLTSIEDSATPGYLDFTFEQL